jgi:adenylate cyclase
MERDESRTIACLQSHRNELIDPKIAQYNGRLVKEMGDGVLLEFLSVVEAVRFAVEIQVAMKVRNRDVSDDDKIVFRIGINLGDVVVKGDDILGDGVNLAARLESHAEPGGIGISASAHDQLSGKLGITLESAGLVTFKNLAKPVHVFRVTIDEKPTRSLLQLRAMRPTVPCYELTKTEYWAFWRLRW